MKILFITIISISLLLSLPLTVGAQSIDLALSPPLIESVIKPGKSILIAYSLQNNGDPAIMKASIKSFTSKDDHGNIEILPDLNGPVRFNLENNTIEMDKPFFMRPHDSTQLLLKMRVPEGAPEGDYYYTLVVETEPPPISAGSATGARATIGANILITVSQNGTSNVDTKIALFDVLSSLKMPFTNTKLRLFDSSDIIPVVLTVQNKGKNFLKPEGSITLRGNFGEKAEYDILPQNILAGSQRLVTATPSATLDCDSSANRSVCKNPATLLLSGFFIGQYQLSTAVDFGENSPILSASTSFIALPIKFMFGLLVVALITIILILKRKE